MKKLKNLIALLLPALLVISFTACGTSSGETTNDDSTPQTTDNSQSQSGDTTVITADSAEKADIESALNLANIKPEWTYSENADAWTMAIVTAVTNAELPDYQGVSVCVPGAYVKGVDTDGDSTADVTSGTASGTLVSADAPKMDGEKPSELPEMNGQPPQMNGQVPEKNGQPPQMNGEAPSDLPEMNREHPANGGLLNDLLSNGIITQAEDEALSEVIEE